MVQFEYKVVGVSGLKGQYVSQVQADERKIEETINRVAVQGWEYQNTIVLPSVTDGEKILFPIFYLVFRRAKS